MEEEQPKKKRIGLGMGIALLFVAICFDLLGAVLTALVPAIGGVLVDCIGVLVFLPWLYLLNVSLISPKQSIQWVINMGADFGTVGVWCGFTVGTILTITVVYFEDKTHVPVTALVSGKNMSRKMLRRLKNPKRALEAQQRLRQMSKVTRAKISSAQRFSFQENGVAGAPSGSITNERPIMKDFAAPKTPNIEGQYTNKILQQSATESAETEKLRRWLAPPDPSNRAFKQPSLSLDEVFASAHGDYARWADKYRPGWREEFKARTGKTWDSLLDKPVTQEKSNGIAERRVGKNETKRAA